VRQDGPAGDWYSPLALVIEPMTGERPIASIPHTTAARKSKIEIDAGHSEPGMPIFVSITVDGKQSDYWAERIAADFGVGVHFRKIWDGKARDFASEEYSVNLDTVSHCHTCECMGFLRYGFCRHVEAAIQLFDAGRLVLPPRPEHVEERPARQVSTEPWCRHCNDDPKTFCSHCSL